jgi:CSLREA domain-containing protein
MSARQRRRRERRRKDAANAADARRNRVLAGAGIALGVGLSLTSAAQAAPQTFTVTSTADPGDGTCDSSCTLRDAIIAANTNANSSDQDVITFSSTITGTPSTITLASALPTITEPLSIQGPGTVAGNSNITISGDGNYKIFAMYGNAYAFGVSGLTLSDGYLANGRGGAIHVEDSGAAMAGEPTLTVQDSELSGNTSAAGGAIYAFRASVSVQDSDISNNTATGHSYGTGGGGIYLFPGIAGTLTIDHSTMSGNTASHGTSMYAHATGGAVHSGGATDILDSTISGNSTDGSHGAGGGLYLNTGLDPSTIQDSTISGNYTTGQYSEGGGLDLTAYSSTIITGSTIVDNYTTGDNANGGAIAFHAGAQDPGNADISIENSTIADNDTSGTAASGGGMFVYYEASLDISNATISGNSTENFGGNIYEYGGAADPSITNSILSGGSAGQLGPELYTGSAGTNFQVAFSLIQNPAGAAIHAAPSYSNITGVDPQLGPIVDNGGPTYTQEPALTSPVIDCGTSDGATTDQRGTGFDRPVELARTNSTVAGADGSDMGAFEVQSGAATGACTNNVPLPPPPSGGGAPTPTPTPTPKKKKCKKKKHKSSAQIAKKCKKKK